MMMNLRLKFNLASACLILIVVLGMMFTLYTAEKKQLWVEIEQEQLADLTKLAAVCEQSMLTADELILINYVKTLLLSPKVPLPALWPRRNRLALLPPKMFQLSDIRTTRLNPFWNQMAC